MASSPILADAEALQLQLKWRCGRAEVASYVEEAKRRLQDPASPDWIILLFSYDHPRLCFREFWLWRPGIVRSFHRVTQSDYHALDEALTSTPGPDKVIAYTGTRFLTEDDNDRMIWLASTAKQWSLEAFKRYFASIPFHIGLSDSDFLVVVQREPYRLVQCREINPNIELMKAIYKRRGTPDYCAQLRSDDVKQGRCSFSPYQEDCTRLEE